MSDIVAPCVDKMTHEQTQALIEHMVARLDEMMVVARNADMCPKCWLTSLITSSLNLFWSHGASFTPEEFTGLFVNVFDLHYKDHGVKIAAVLLDDSERLRIKSLPMN